MYSAEIPFQSFIPFREFRMFK